MRVPHSFLISSATISFLAIFIYASHSGYLTSYLPAIYSFKSLSNSSQQTAHISLVAYYYALLLLLAMTLQFVTRQIAHNKWKWLPNYAQMNSLLQTLLERGVIFGCLYVYLVLNSGFGLKPKRIGLLALWFLVASLANVVSIWAMAFTKRRGIRFSWLLHYFTLAVMLAKIYGFNILTLIK